MNAISLPIRRRPARTAASRFVGSPGGVRAALIVLGALTLLLTARFTLGLGSERLEGLADTWIYHGVMLGAGGLCLGRGLAHRSLPWALLGLAVVVWALGSVYWTLFLDTGALPAFSPADALWLAFYPPACAALLLLRGRRHRRALWLDGLVCALALAAAGAAVLLDAVLDASRGERLGIVATNLAYPLADLLLLGLVVAALGASGWRVERTWALIASGIAIFAVSDSIYLYQVAVDSYAVGSLVDLGWVAAAVVLAWAAWHPSRRPSPEAQEDVRGLLFLAGSGLLALAVLVYGHFSPVNVLALALATAAILAVIVRLVLIFRDKLRLVARAHHDARTDTVTGLWNRRQLLDDLSARLQEADAPQGALVLFDLDGFKLYNDTFGHAAGDALLERLGHRLVAAVAERGTAYRIGGDEFCVLGGADESDPDFLAARLSPALGEHGEGFRVTASYGTVRLGEEGTTASALLQLADHRMYARKRGGRRPIVAEASGVLPRALAERSTYLEGHVESVVRMADAVAAELALDADARDRLRTAARLHDVGKMAIPEAILEKAGPLDESESELMRRHTIVGERILRAAPALAPVGAIVRATHERFDGKGYPDGLHGQEIPLEARIIFACDAYDAMVAGRPYAPPVTSDAALAELARGAGTQFDPAVVAALLKLLEAGDPVSSAA